MPATILYDFGDMVRSYTNLKEEDDLILRMYSVENIMML